MEIKRVLKYPEKYNIYLDKEIRINMKIKQATTGILWQEKIREFILKELEINENNR